MSLLTRIKQAQVAARKQPAVSRDQQRIDLLTTLIGEAEVIGKNDGGREVTDAEVVGVLKKFVKNANDTLDAIYKQYGQIEGGPVMTPFYELKILNEFLPAQMSNGDIEKAVGEIIASLGGKPNMGQVMAALKAKYDGLYDGKVASGIVKTALA